MSFDVYCILFIRWEKDGDRDREGHGETGNMKASLDSSGFNLFQKAHPQAQITASRCFVIKNRQYWHPYFSQLEAYVQSNV